MFDAQMGGSPQPVGLLGFQKIEKLCFFVDTTAGDDFPTEKMLTTKIWDREEFETEHDLQGGAWWS